MILDDQKNTICFKDTLIELAQNEKESLVK